MFVPSESVYAELHDGFDDLIQKAYRAQVVLVSPSLLDARDPGDAADPEGRAHARGRARDPHRGRASDARPDRLRERVLNLQKHFGQANEDVAQILTSAEKVVRRGGRIESLEFGDDSTQGPMAIPAPVGRKATAAE